MRHPAFLVALVLVVFAGHSQSQAAAFVNPFEQEPKVEKHIRVQSLSQYVKWAGKPPSVGGYDPQYFERVRLGTVAFGPNLKLHIDVIRDKVHFPSYFELIDVRRGRVLGKYAVVDPEDAEWYFPGNGFAYLNQSHLALCGPRHTRKIMQQGGDLIEVQQALEFVGAEADVAIATHLFESPASKKVVATVLAGSKVTVLGLLPGRSGFYEMAYLVKTPFGLTGWHVPRDVPEDGRLSIYQCN